MVFGYEGLDSSSIFLPGIWASGFFILVFSWYFLKDNLHASIVVFIFASLILYLEGPGAIAFALCLSSGWTSLNFFVEKIIPISHSIE